MADEVTLFFAGGGTGGHLYPGIAVAQQLRLRLPQAKPVFLCTQRAIDKTILEPTGFEFIPQPIVPPRTTIGGLLRFWTHWRETKDQVRQLFHDRRPGAVLGLGGYAAGVAVARAAKKGVPTALLNPDVIPGKANQFLMRQTQAVCCQFHQTNDHVPADLRSKLRITGCPIREEITRPIDKNQALQRLQLEEDLLTLVVTGASLGAQTVNEAVLKMLATLPLPGWQILHLSGGEHADAVRAGYAGIAVPHRVIDFTPDMADVWAVADLCISRAGASSCAELTACGVPSLLMPYPYHKDMHQRANARVLADGGAAILIDDSKQAAENAAKLMAAIQPLLNDPARRRAMSNAARALGRTDAAAAVANVLISLLDTPRD